MSAPLPSVSQLQERLCDQTRPIGARMRALFSLRAVKTNDAVDAMACGLSDDSVLLKHEICYCLGQMNNPHAFGTLVNVLEDRAEDAMVRHEAAEALGALALPSCIPILEKFLQDESRDVVETCEIALERVRWIHSKDGQGSGTGAGGRYEGAFDSIDPAPAVEDAMSTEELKELLMNEKETLFNRYRALFTLRNAGDEQSVRAIADAMTADQSSALFRHELAYVLGQLEHPAAADGLLELTWYGETGTLWWNLLQMLQRSGENKMVRHEAAEALGAIGTPSIMEKLKNYCNDREKCVAESCDVALDVSSSHDAFQYADVDARA